MKPGDGPDGNNGPKKPTKWAQTVEIPEDELAAIEEQLRTMGIEHGLQSPDDGEITAHIERLRDLPLFEQALVNLGFTQEVEYLETLPPNGRAFSITVKAQDYTRTQRLLNENPSIFPLSKSQYRGSREDTHLTINLFAKEETTIFALTRKLESEKLPCSIRYYNEEDVPLLRVKDEIIPLHSAFARPQESEFELGEHPHLATIAKQKGGKSAPSPAKAEATEVSAPEKPLEGLDASAFGELLIHGRGSMPTARKSAATNELPPEGPAVSVEIDIAQIIKEKDTNDETRTTYNQVIGFIAAEAFSRDIVIKPHHGRILISCTTERGGTAIRHLARKVRTVGKGKIFQIYSHGEIEHSTSQARSFYLNGATTTEESLAAKKISEAIENGDILLHKRDALAIMRGERPRDNTHYQFELEEIEGTDYYRVKEIKTETFTKTGGPEILIDYEEPLAELKKAYDPIHGPKLTVLKAAAGKGKSRLAHEAAQFGRTITVSFDPSKENCNGYQMVFTAERVAEQLEALRQSYQTAYNETARFDKARALPIQAYLAPLNNLYNFTQQDEVSKIRTANNNPDEIVELCKDALKIYKEYYGHFVFVLDDIHHTDPNSSRPAKDLMKTLINDLGVNVIRIERPEEEYAQAPQIELEEEIAQEHGKDNVNVVNLGDGLDFTKNLDAEAPGASTAYRYIFYSLPEEVRFNKTTHSERQLGDWFRNLAQMANSPLEMDAFISRILERNENGEFINLDFDENTIFLKRPQVLREIEDDGGTTDMQTYNRKRLRRLSPIAFNTLLCVAMLGSSLTIEETATRMKAAGIPTLSKDERKSQLIDRHFLLPSGSDSYKLQHDTLRAAVLETAGKGKRKNVALRLFAAVKDKPDISPDTKFAILQFASDSGLSNKEYWANYAQYATETLEAADLYGEHSRTYEIAMSVISGENGLNQSLNNDKRVNQALYAVKRNPLHKVPPHVVQLIQTCLEKITIHGLQIGKFKDVYHASNLLVELARRGLDININEIYRRAFDAAYYANDKQKLKEYYEEIDQDKLSPAQKLLVETKYKHRITEENDIQGQKDAIAHLSREKITALDDATEAEKAQLGRLEKRMEFELIRIKTIKNLNVDEDVSMQPTLFTPSQQSRLLEFRRESEKMLEKGILPPMEKLLTLDLIGQINAYLGIYQNLTVEDSVHVGALEHFRESGRIATQMQAHPSVARMRMLEGNAAMQLAITYRSGRDVPGLVGGLHRRRSIDREWVKRALAIYKSGLTAIGKVDGETNFNLILRGQIIRAVGKLCDSYIPELTQARKEGNTNKIKQIANELAPEIKEAFEAYSYINNEEPFKSWAKDEQFASYCSYYIAPHIGNMLYTYLAFKKAMDRGKEGIQCPEIFDFANNPYLTPKSIGSAISELLQRRIEIKQRAEDQENDVTGEVDDKITGTTRYLQVATHFAKTHTTGRTAIPQFQAINLEIQTALAA